MKTRGLLNAQNMPVEELFLGDPGSLGHPDLCIQELLCFVQ